ncbi:recombinase family protein [Streptomyces antarcticus]|uniref:recombinase family protein n=1 Tax=Streptomyces antarcticus TaxID=2996458 RepID=UPI00226ECFDA|nr:MULTISPECIES: recombinase family protein [unclassified Streptomyces]MCY0941882.1 recombinase family protein [Streptomyces sp. H34-AA3]MCZ4082845.1 recombinase family protein [Streptomyces sp. H34-S5]
MLAKPLGGYCRISDADLADIRRALKAGLLTPEEAAEEERKGVLRQREDIESLAGGAPIRWYEDNNLSAFKRNVRRPDFEQMVKDLAAKRIAGVLAYDIDRVYRQPRDLERVIDIYETSKEPLVFKTLSGQNFDLTTADGRFSARLFVNIANKSSEDTKRRVVRGNLSKARKGQSNATGLVFGWLESDPSKLDRETAPIRRKAVDKHIAGDRIATVMQWLADENVINIATGKHFTWGGTKAMIYSPRNWGIRTYKEEIIYDDGNAIVMGNWEPIFPTMDTWHLVQSLRKQRSKQNPGESNVSYLLTGIARCGRCGTGLKGKPKWKKGERTPQYQYNCNKQRPEHCGSLSTDGLHLDALIQDLVWAQVLRASKQKQVASAMAEPWIGTAELQDVENDIKELQDLWTAKKVKAVSYVTALDDLNARKNELLADRAYHTVPAGTRSITEELLTNGWGNLSIERQRIIVRKVLRAVIIHPAKSRGGRFDPARVEPVFH